MKCFVGREWRKERKGRKVLLVKYLFEKKKNQPSRVWYPMLHSCSPDKLFSLPYQCAVLEIKVIIPDGPFHNYPMKRIVDRSFSGKLNLLIDLFIIFT